MSDFRDATFIPVTPPKKAISDFSGTLSAGALNSLEAQVAALPGMKAKVVVLPSDFHVDNFKTFAVDLAQTWHVSGNRFLVVVDVKDHKVEMLAGRDLAASGLTGQTISGQIVAQNFVPHMKQHDLEGAISSSLAASASVVQQGQSTGTTAYQGQPVQTPPPPAHDLWYLMMPWAIIGGVCALLYFVSVNQRNKDNTKLIDQFKERVSPLYEQADQIGSASEYLSTENNHDLAQRIATFFNRLTTFETAVKEAEQLQKQNKVWQVRDAYLNLIRMTGLLLPEAAKLKEDVNAVTGGVETFKTDTTASITDQAKVDGGEFIKIPEKVFQSQNYRRPSWSYEPAYYQPVDNGLGGMASMMILMNQMQMMSYGMNHHYRDDYSPFIGSNSNDSGWSSGGGSWDSGSSDFVEGGGSWDSGGSDFGGGGDSGGGDW